MRAPFRRVLFFAVLDAGFHGRILQGVMRYARAHPWTVIHGCWAYGDPLRFFDEVRPDGVIINAMLPEWVGHLDARGTPWVNIGYHPAMTPTICADVGREAKLAVDHLLSRGFRQFAFCGLCNVEYSVAREAAFRAELTRRGSDCLVSGNLWPTGTTRWVGSLPKPIAIMAANDDQAFQIIQACREADVRVPDQVAVIGVDNSLLSLLCEPTLTTVDTCGDVIGQRAAELLDRLMIGAPPPARPIMVPPAGLVIRSSTDATRDVDTDLAQALAFIHDNACRHITVADVLRAVPVSRRCLERRFRAELGRSIHDEIRAARLEEVKQMLRSTDLPLSVIADETGYGTAANLSMVFHKVIGTTAGDFRRRFRSVASHA